MPEGRSGSDVAESSWTDVACRVEPCRSRGSECQRVGSLPVAADPCDVVAPLSVAPSRLSPAKSSVELRSPLDRRNSAGAGEIEAVIWRSRGGV